MNDITHDCHALVLFGATGDLARRMLWPSLYALHVDGLLSEDFALIGAATSPNTDEQFLAKVRDAIQRSANAKLFEEAAFAAFAKRVRYVSVNVSAADGLEPVRAALGARADGGIIYYLSTGPQLFGPICRALRAADLVNPRCRVVVEKPIGTDSASAHRTNEDIAAAFNEHQVFRIDHYLAQEAGRNRIALPSANA